MDIFFLKEFRSLVSFLMILYSKSRDSTTKLFIVVHNDQKPIYVSSFSNKFKIL